MSDWRDEHERDSLNFEDEEQALPRGEGEGEANEALVARGGRAITDTRALPTTAASA